MKQEVHLIIPGRVNTRTLRTLVGVALVLLTSAALADQFYNVTDLVALGGTPASQSAGTVSPACLCGNFLIVRGVVHTRIYARPAAPVCRSQELTRGFQ